MHEISLGSPDGPTGAITEAVQRMSKYGFSKRFSLRRDNEHGVSLARYPSAGLRFGANLILRLFIHRGTYADSTDLFIA